MILSFKHFLNEMAKSVLKQKDDEHDLSKVVNAIPRNHLGKINSPEDFHAYVDKNSSVFESAGLKSTEAIKSYGHAVHAFLNHNPTPKEKGSSTVREALQNGGHVEVYGAKKKENKLHKDWKGGKNTTPKTDLVVRNEDNSIHSRTSLKEGDRPQLMSGESENVKGIYHAAAKSLYPSNSEEHQTARKDIEDKISQLTSIQKKSKKIKNENKREELVTQGQSIIDNLHAAHPKLANHVFKVAATGEGQFEEGSPAIASHVLSYRRSITEGAAKIIDPSNAKQLGKFKFRFARGKGDRKKKINGKTVRVGKRQHALRIDTFPFKEKP